MDLKNPVVGRGSTADGTYVIEPAQHPSFFSERQLKPYDSGRLSYNMTAETNGPLLTSGIPGQVTPKRGCLNNNRVLQYVDTDFGQDLSNCAAVLYVSACFVQK